MAIRIARFAAGCSLLFFLLTPRVYGQAPQDAQQLDPNDAEYRQLDELLSLLRTTKLSNKPIRAHGQTASALAV